MMTSLSHPFTHPSFPGLYLCHVLYISLYVHTYNLGGFHCMACLICRRWFWLVLGLHLHVLFFYIDGRGKVGWTGQRSR